MRTTDGLSIMSVSTVLAGVCCLALLSTVANGGIVNYGWEDGGTTIGMFGSGSPPIVATNVAAPDPVYSGLRSLRLEDNSPSGTPQAYIAWVKGLQDGDSITATVWRYDDTPDSTAPSFRIWGHWNDDPDDLNGFNGSALGNEDYGPGTGWDQTAHTWVVADGHTGLVIEIRTYSNPGDTVWVDDLAITAPDHATIMVPEPATLGLLLLGGLALLRRKR